MRPRTIDSLMENFVDSSGVVPIGARRLFDYEARSHAAPWLRRLLGRGVACDYVIGYACGQSWWTFCFDRRPELESDAEEAEVWKIEAYDSIGRGWTDTFKFWSESDRWQLVVLESSLRSDTTDETAGLPSDIPPRYS
jgi:hypothetical protein